MSLFSWLAIVVTDIVPVTFMWNIVAAASRADTIRTDRPARHMMVEFTPDVGGPIEAYPDDSLVVIGLNSNYCFLYERGPSRTHIIPIRYVKRVFVGSTPTGKHEPADGVESGGATRTPCEETNP